MIFIEMMLKVVYLEKFNIFNVLIFNYFLCPLHKPTQIGKSPHKLNSIVKLSTLKPDRKTLRPFFPKYFSLSSLFGFGLITTATTTIITFKSIKKYITIAIILLYCKIKYLVLTIMTMYLICRGSIVYIEIS